MSDQEHPNKPDPEAAGDAEQGGAADDAAPKPEGSAPDPADSASPQPEASAEPEATEQAEGAASEASTQEQGTAAEHLASEALRAAQDAVQGMGDGAAAVDMPAFKKGAANASGEGIDLLSDVNLEVAIELGRTRMYVEDVLRLGEGAVVELDKLAGDPVDVYVNGRHVARGEVLILNDNFCVRINDIIKQQAEPQSKRSA